VENSNYSLSRLGEDVQACITKIYITVLYYVGSADNVNHDITLYYRIPYLLQYEECT